MYTIQTLKALNPVYDLEHGVTQEIVDRVNMMVNIIESSRTDEHIQPGDIAEYTDIYGECFLNAVICAYDGIGDSWDVYRYPDIPRVRIDEERNNLSYIVNGGLQATIPNGLRLLGKRNRSFSTLGSTYILPRHCIVVFYAPVNVWEYVEPGALHGEYSTKNWARTYITDLGDASAKPALKTSDDEYRYVSNSIMLKDRHDYQAWLKTYRGVEFPCPEPNNMAVFHYREGNHLISREEWDSLDLPLDTRYCNGLILCKVRYDDDAHVVYVYRYSNTGDLDRRIFKEYTLARNIVPIHFK